MLAGRLGLSAVMIGRQAALGRLRRLAVSPDFQLALVSGEAGIGKTRLLRELAPVAGRPVWAGQAEPAGISQPLGIVHDLLGVAAAETPADAVAALVEAIGGHPAIVIFEDLHWADAGSVEVFERLARMRPAGLLLIGTYRTEELSRRLPGGDMLARLERRHDVARIHLDRLDRSEVAAFLASAYGRPVPSSVSDAMYERTGGNPFFLEELAGCCGDIEPDQLAGQPLPWTLEEVVRRQLDGLSGTDRRVAEAAAILGPSASFDVLAAVVGMGESELVGQLRNLVDSGLLVEHREDHFTFRHALVRDAVEQHLLGRERRRLHEQVLALLGARPDPNSAEMARHAAGAGRYDEMVVHARAGALVELERGATHLALRLADDALAEEPDDPVMLAVAVEAAWLIGLHDEALAAAHRLLDVARTAGSLGGRATAIRWIARLHHDRNEDELTVAQLGPLEALLDEPLEPLDRVRTLAALAQMRMLRNECADAIRWADLAIAEATAIGARDVRAQALVERGSAAISLDRAATVELELAVAEAESLGLWVLVARGLNNLFDGVSVHTEYGRSILNRFRDAADRAGFDSMSSVVYQVRLVDLGFGLGDLSLVEDTLARTLEWLPLHRYNETDWVEARRLQLELEHGRPVQFTDVDALRPGAACVTQQDHELWRLSFGLAVAAASGDVPRGRDYLGGLAADIHRADPNVLVESVQAGFRLGLDPDELTAALLPVDLPERLTAAGAIGRGLLAQAVHHHAEAVERLRTALADPDENLTVPVLGHLWTLVGSSELAQGHREAAAQAAATAAGLLAGWGGWRNRRLAELQARLAAPVAGPSSELTGREREVAALVADGLSNGEIARRLFISPKTASVHVSNILMKLAMANRAEIAAWVVRTGLNAP